MHRRQLLWTLAAGALVKPQQIGVAQGAAALAEDAGEAAYVGRDLVRIKVSPASPGRLAMITQDVTPGTSIPVHLHEREDEIIFIQSGRGVATLGDQSVPLEAGSTLVVPQNTWHGGRNTGSEILKWIAIYSPSGFEGYFREIGRRAPGDPPKILPPDARVERDRRYGIRYR